MMKAKEGKTASSYCNGAPPLSAKSDTSRWESLLAGAKSGGVGSATLTLAHRISVLEPGASPAVPAGTVLSNGHGTAVSIKPSSSKKRKRDKGRGAVSAAPSGPSNWKKLLNKPGHNIPPSGRVSGSVTAASATAKGDPTALSKTKGKRKKRPLPVSSDSFAELEEIRSAVAVKGTAHQRNRVIHVGGCNSAEPSVGAKGPAQASKECKRDNATGKVETAGGGDRKSKDDEPKKLLKYENTRSGNAKSGQVSNHHHHNQKRPKPNDLNLAYRAQVQEAASLEKKGDTGQGRANGLAGGAGGRGGKGREQVLTRAEQSQYVGLDCEMVGVGPGGCRNALARCCMVDWEGKIIYDKHVTPNERVTDFRTFVSGVKAKHLRGGLPLRTCQEEVAAILKGKVLVGHALHNDLKALLLTHPPRMIRDTATYRPYQKAHGKAGGKLQAKSLKKLSLEHLERTIQEGQHHPAEDARAAMDLYKAARQEWEKSLLVAGKMRRRRAVVNQQER